MRVRLLPLMRTKGISGPFFTGGFKTVGNTIGGSDPIINGGAEEGDMTAWSFLPTGKVTVRADDEASSGLVTPYEGDYFFAGNDFTALGITEGGMYSDPVKHNVTESMLVDGVAYATLDYQVTKSDDDKVSAGFIFWDEDSVEISRQLNNEHRPVGTYDWYPERVVLKIPEGCVYYSAYFWIYRDDGAYASLYFDNIVLGWEQYSNFDLALVNPSAETGDTTGWTNSSGGLGVKAGGVDGSYFFFGGPNLLTIANSTDFVDLIAGGASATDIDAGNGRLGVTFYHTTYAQADSAMLGIEYYDSVDGFISRDDSTVPTPLPASWVKYYLDQTIPATARSIKVRLYIARSSGTNNDGYVDDIQINYRREV